jgi:ecotin
MWFSSQALAADDLGPYPSPDDGYKRMVVKLPPVADETARKVEIIVGKNQTVDCNSTWFSGDLTTETVMGWGLRYHSVKKIAGPSATMKLCPADEQKKQAFVQMRGAGLIHDYDSRSPMVVYVPNGFQVKFRIWPASGDLGNTRKQ